MRSYRWLVILGLLAMVPLSALAAAKAVPVSPGQYTMGHQTEREKIKNDDFRILSAMNLFARKPDDLEVNLGEKIDPAKLTYGFVELGSPRGHVYLAMLKTKDSYIESLFVDANNDLKLVAEETVEIKKESPTTENGYEWQWIKALRAVNCTVRYTGADGRPIDRPVAVQFHFLHNKPLKPGSSSDQNLAPLFSMFSVDSWFTGTGRFAGDKGEPAELSFAVLDGNDNGVFNDFGRDLLLIDLNKDGYFDRSKEAAPLPEFTEDGGKNPIQERIALFAWPSVVLVQPAKEPMDWAALEPR